MTQPAATIRVGDIRGLSGAEAAEVGRAQLYALIEFVRTLTPEEWDKPTDCELWSVKDIVCHVTGMAEGFVDFKELVHQWNAGRKRRSEFDNPLAAMNQVEVDERSHLTTDELIGRLEAVTPRILKRRATLGKWLRYVPLYDGSVLGMSNLGYLLNPILSRDYYTHRTDIARGTGRERPSDPTDARLVEDVIRDWVRRRDVNATIVLDETTTFVAGSGTGARIESGSVDLMRVLSGRGSPEEITDDPKAKAWIAAGCPF